MHDGKIKGANRPATRGAEYQVKGTKVAPMPGPVGEQDQAVSPKSANIGATRGVGAGGAKVSQTVLRSGDSRAFGLKG